ncbi:MAG: hypothetical protein NVSMB42_17940 [Herpetosiphon sp.]
MLHVAAAIVAIVLLFGILLDAFETMILPRRVSRGFRPTVLFYVFGWRIWSKSSRLIRMKHRRESFLSAFGPLSLLLLLALWAGGMIVGFSLLQWSLGSQVSISQGVPTIFTDLYLSGTTFFTLGLGDIVPLSRAARFFVVLEAGTGFGFLAVVIGYLPVLYQAFSRREATISLLDARAGSPPSAGELLRRQELLQDQESLLYVLREWERWSAELLESHLSFPLLAYYRSQHDEQSWVSMLTMILDLSALVMVSLPGTAQRTARLTFAMARHAAVDLSQIFQTRPQQKTGNRLPPADLDRLRQMLGDDERSLEGTALAHLTELRSLYEPYILALSNYLLLPLPHWVPATQTPDDWETSAWEHMKQA